KVGMGTLLFEFHELFLQRQRGKIVHHAQIFINECRHCLKMLYFYRRCSDLSRCRLPTSLPGLAISACHPVAVSRTIHEHLGPFQFESAMRAEAKARIRINDLLSKSGWRFFADDNGPANIQLEAYVKLTKKSLDGLGSDFEKTAHGYVDYVLLDGRGFPIAVLEAKSEKFEPLVGKEQARTYARSQNVRFVILSNGNLHYFWDLEQGNPTLITEFPTAESLGHFAAFKPNPESLVNEKVENDYIAITQNPNYRSDPRWNDRLQR